MKLGITGAAALLVFILSKAIAQTDSGTGRIYRIGGDVSAPVVAYAPDPEYSEQALAAKYEGTCVLSLVVDSEGRPQKVKVVRRLGLGLDEKAIEAVEAWRFKPAMKNGNPVAVQLNVMVTFHLYRKPPSKSDLKAKSDLQDKLNQKKVDPNTLRDQERLAAISAQYHQKYTDEQLADLRTKCAPYKDAKLEDLQSKKVPLPPHECVGVLGWMRDLSVESLYPTQQ